MRNHEGVFSTTTGEFSFFNDWESSELKKTYEDNKEVSLNAEPLTICRGIEVRHPIFYLKLISKLNTPTPYGDDKPAAYKYLCSLEFLGKRLSINKTKREQINKIYLASTAKGLLPSDSELRKLLGTHWKRCIRKLVDESWIKLIHVREENQNRWMINPRFTLMRNEWSPLAQEQIKQGYRVGELDHITIMKNSTRSF
jgi:hypothetical protein